MGDWDDRRCGRPGIRAGVMSGKTLWIRKMHLLMHLTFLLALPVTYHPARPSLLQTKLCHLHHWWILPQTACLQHHLLLPHVVLPP